MLAQITPIIITYNEQANIGRTLKALSWANDVLIVDSFSDDDTLKIVARYPNTRVVQRAFDDFASQCNFALQQLTSPWALSLDADYVLSENLIKELSTLEPNQQIAAYQTSFVYKVNGKPLRGSLYPDRVTLYRPTHASYLQDGHAHRVEIAGAVDKLNGVIYHDDRKPYSRWLTAQQKYAHQEAEKLSQTTWQSLSWPDRVRKIPGLSLLLILPYTLLLKGLILNGMPGLIYAWQRLYAEYAIQMALIKNWCNRLL